ncbi:MAG: hypothetical protein FWC19_06340 [Treponema sp.]|nr:hypothetical protein [Treponema sp.]
MAYKKTEWKARRGTNLNKFRKTEETDEYVILENVPDVITESGTPFSPENMNNIEQGIFEAHEAISGVDVSGKADRVSGAVNGNFAALNAQGNLSDSGKKAADFQPAGSYAPANASLAATTNTDTTTSTLAVSSAALGTVLQTIWNKIRSVVNQMDTIASGGGSGGNNTKSTTLVIGTSTAGHTAAEVDFLCTGTNDQNVINNAINALPEGGGKIIIREGNYNTTATCTISNRKNITIEGMGMEATHITGWFTLNNCSNITFSKITLTRTVSGFIGLFYIQNTVNHLKIIDCILRPKNTIASVYSGECFILGNNSVFNGDYFSIIRCRIEFYSLGYAITFYNGRILHSLLKDSYITLINESNQLTGNQPGNLVISAEKGHITTGCIMTFPLGKPANVSIFNTNNLYNINNLIVNNDFSDSAIPITSKKGSLITIEAFGTNSAMGFNL